MEKIYRLRNVANELLRKRGHVYSRYQREFHIVDGALVKILFNFCNRCGAWVRITDYPKLLKEFPNKEFLGPGFKYNCKHGEVPLEQVEFKNVFAGKFSEEYQRRLADRKRKTIKRFQI